MSALEYGKKELMQKVMEAGFALNEAVLFLDTHPKDEEALCAYHRYNAEYKECCDRYAKKYGPLFFTQIEEEHCSSWVKGPWPWEGGEC